MAAPGRDIRVWAGDIPLAELYSLGGRIEVPEMVKLVIDLRTGEVAGGGWLHYDCQEVLRARGSRQGDLWGVIWHLDRDGDDAVEFDSRINQRPGEGNTTRGVQDPSTREAILRLLSRRVVIW